jgi:chemotaxis protein MotB
MNLKIACLVVATAASLMLGGCVAKSDYLQKTAEADARGRQLEALSAENLSLIDKIRFLTSETETLLGQRQGLVVEKDALVREREALNERLKAKGTETEQTVQKLGNRIAELEGDAQMLQESIALLKKRKEEELQTVSRTYEDRIKEMKEELQAVSKACEDRIEEMKEELQAVSTTYEDRIKEMNEEVQATSTTYEDLLTEMKNEIEEGQITITELKGKLTLNVVDRILFNSGQAEVKPEGLKVLGRVVEILRTVTDKTVRVEGHTDNRPIAGNLARKYPSNWELSAARAINVIRYLEKKGLDPALLSAAAFGAYQPVADNETPEGRAKNRRIAIILLPKESETGESPPRIEDVQTQTGDGPPPPRKESH